uniref:Uncharacterized protein n=1 Tax=Arundo donax TaxID=35708 RepID=A0A0A9B308_ARUDO
MNVNAENIVPTPVYHVKLSNSAFSLVLCQVE